MEPENKPLPARIRTETPDSRVTIDYKPRRVTMHYVSDQELETIGNASNDFSLYLAFFGASISLAGASAITLSTVELTDPRTYFGYCAALVVSAPATVFFLIKALLGWKKARQHIRAIQGESINREQERAV